MSLEKNEKRVLKLSKISFKAEVLNSRIEKFDMKGLNKKSSIYSIHMLKKQCTYILEIV